MLGKGKHCNRDITLYSTRLIANLLFSWPPVSHSLHHWTRCIWVYPYVFSENRNEQTRTVCCMLSCKACKITGMKNGGGREKALTKQIWWRITRLWIHYLVVSSSLTPIIGTEKTVSRLSTVSRKMQDRRKFVVGMQPSALPTPSRLCTPRTKRCGAYAGQKSDKTKPGLDLKLPST